MRPCLCVCIVVFCLHTHGLFKTSLICEVSEVSQAASICPKVMNGRLERRCQGSECLNSVQQHYCSEGMFNFNGELVLYDKSK